jgi:exonuclease I
LTLIYIGIIFGAMENTVQKCCTALEMQIWHPENIIMKDLGRKIAEAINSDKDFITDHIFANPNGDGKQVYIYDYVYDDKRDKSEDY